MKTMKVNKKLIYGVGYNDANYKVQPVVDGKQVTCKIYSRFRVMYQRCYSSQFHSRNPQYTECTISKDWHNFMDFHRWMSPQNWEGMHLDKDIMFPDNKIYSPETCRFVPSIINGFFTFRNTKSNNGLPIGVSRHRSIYQVQIKDNGIVYNLGTTCDVEEAGRIWVDNKVRILDTHIANPEYHSFRDGLVRHREVLLA